MAMVLDQFVQTALGRLAVFAEQEVCRVLGVKEEIKRLHRRMTRISSFLEDAERKRHCNRVIDTWVNELKDIMYDADDIIDLCMFRDGNLPDLFPSKRKLLELQPSSSSSISFPLCVKHRREVANRIEELNERLKEFAEDNQIMPKLVENNDEKGSRGSIATSRETSLLQVDSEIVGRQIEFAANEIIKWISEDGQRRCQVYGIIGMGGIGKTTLARKILNSKKIKDNFPKTIWLYVSKNYSETKLLGQLIRETRGDNDDGAESKSELEQKLARTLPSHKKILIVLDDLWSGDVWNKLLRAPIISSGVISKILFTSRHAEVGREMGAIDDHIHHVEKINKKSGWALLRKIVFRGEDEIMMPAVLEEIGIKIVDKCDGLPLAIEVIGGILSRKERTPREWEKVLHSNLWRMNQIDDEIPKALYLSYEDLPSKLKPCFLGCALFRGVTDYNHLIQLWMAEGFIAEEQNKLMEELGEDSYKELVSRNLLQRHHLFEHLFIMHDLLRALATSLMETEGIILNEGETWKGNNPLTKFRRMSISSKRDKLVLPKAILEQKCLRVLRVYDSPEITTIENDMLKILGHLRVLDLSYTSIESIPNSIENLLHLRCLYLNGTKICKLPESLGHLKNLQNLGIQNCRSLYRLPNSITGSCNLRTLCLDGTPLTHVPKGVGTLTDINTLTGFVVGGCDGSANGEGCDLEELQYLSSLRHLEIQKLERTTSIEGVKILSNQHFLRRLCLSWSEERAPSTSDDEEHIIKRAENVFNQLVLPTTLEKLKIFNFPGRQLPCWMMSASLDASFPRLALLEISFFPICAKLPPLGHLPQLKGLKIVGAHGIKKIGAEFLGDRDFSKLPAFPNLKYLYLEDMPNWEEWELCMEEVEEKANGDERNRLKLFPNLTRCEFTGCSRLRALPEVFYHATKFKFLKVQHCERLERISSLPFLKELIIVDCPCLERVGNIEMLQSLFLTCPPTYYEEFLPLCLLGLAHQSQHSLVEFQMICSLPLLKSCLKGKPNWHAFEKMPEVSIKTFDDMHSMRYIKDPPYYAAIGIVDSE